MRKKQNPENLRRASARYRLKNLEAVKTFQKQYRRTVAAVERKKRRDLAQRGFTPELWQMTLEAQNHHCPICRADLQALPSSRIHADHCHKTMRPRGILCVSCNMGLGLFKDNPHLLEWAAEYLRRPTILPIPAVEVHHAPG